jgi:hypothetical protein
LWDQSLYQSIMKGTGQTRIGVVSKRSWSEMDLVQIQPPEEGNIQARGAAHKFDSTTPS